MKKYILAILLLNLFSMQTHASENPTTVNMTVRYLHNDKVEVTYIMSVEEFNETIRIPNKASSSQKGLHRKRYRVTCHKKKPDGSHESWVEKGYTSALVHPVAAAGCMAKVGDPSHSLQKL